MARSSRARSERFDTQVSLYKSRKESDGIGGQLVVCNDDCKVADADANVEYMSGSRLLWFKTQGYSKPVTIRLYNVGVDFDTVKVGDQQITITSIDTDKQNTLITVIMGDVIDDTV